MASLIVVARRLGLTLTPADLGFDGSTNVAGDMPMAEIARRARRCDLRCKAVRPTWEALTKRRWTSAPLIVRFKDGTSMVLLRVDIVQGSPFVILEDPHAGPDAPLAVDRLRFLDAWSGDAILVKRHQKVVDETMPFGFPMIAKLFFADRRVMVQIVAASLGLSALGLTPVLYMRIVTSRIVEYKSVSTLITLSLIMLVMIGIETGLMAARRYLADHIAVKVDLLLSTYVFNKVLRLPIEHFEHMSAGETIYRVSMTARIRDNLLTKVVTVVLEASTLIFFIPVLLILSPVLTSLVLVVFIISITWILAMMPTYRKVAGAAEGADAAKGFYLYQTIAGMRTIKSLALDARQRSQYSALCVKAADNRMAEGHVSMLMDTVVMVLQRFLVLGTMAGGAWLALYDDQLVSLSTLFAFVLLIQRVSSPLHNIGELVQMIDESRIAVRFVAGLVNQPAEEGRSGRGLFTPIRGHIEFVDLRFKYRGSTRLALSSVSFDVPKGMTLGIMGRSGSGKTTVTRLLQRLHSDYQGLIKIDGVDVREYDVDHLRSSMGVVLQDNFLFSGTIRDNLTVAKPDASFDDVVRVARLAGAAEFIDKLPKGYDTFIYEGSPNLSGGQRQRIAIARALITDPKLLILDEATSALDAESEAIVNANLKLIAHGRTMLVISHRLASLVSADAIMVLDQGEVHDIGTHYELLERCDIYSGLWHHQHPHTDEPPQPKIIGRAALATT